MIVAKARLPRRAFLFFDTPLLHHEFPDFFIKVIPQNISPVVAGADAKAAMGLGVPATENLIH